MKDLDTRTRGSNIAAKVGLILGYGVGVLLLLAILAFGIWREGTIWHWW